MPFSLNCVWRAARVLLLWKTNACVCDVVVVNPMKVMSCVDIEVYILMMQMCCISACEKAELVLRNWSNQSKVK